MMITVANYFYPKVLEINSAKDFENVLTDCNF